MTNAPRTERYGVARGYRLAGKVFLLPDPWTLLKRAVRLTSRKLIWLAGLALIGIGVLCLFLSDSVARTGTWWQGTWQALGVGFVVGGIVDVIAISLMSRLSSAWQRRWNDQAMAFLRNPHNPDDNPNLFAYWLVTEHGHDIDPGLRRELRKLAQKEPGFWGRGESTANPTTGDY